MLSSSGQLVMLIYRTNDTYKHCCAVETQRLLTIIPNDYLQQLELSVKLIVTLINIPMNKNSNLLVTAISYFNYFLVCMSLLGKLSKLKSTRVVSTWISYSAHVHSVNFSFVLSWPSVTLCEDLWMFMCFKAS